MNLSNYCDEQEREWKLEEKATTEKLINYLSALIGKDLYQFEKDFNHADKTSDSIQVFNKLKLWLLNCHQKELLEGLQYVGIDELDFNKKMIFDLATLFTKDAFNKDFVCTILKNTDIIEDVLSYDNGSYVIITNEFGNIKFIKADEVFANDKDTLRFIDNLGDKVADGCHEISFYLIKAYDSLKATTSVCKKGLNDHYYHSYILDNDNNVIDFTQNLIMPKDQYEMLQGAQELNCITYQEYLEEEKESKQFDESGTLFGLLRNALYKQSIMEQNSVKHHHTKQN